MRLIRYIGGNRTEGKIETGLTGKSGECSVVRIINRDSRMISKKVSLCSSFPHIGVMWPSFV